MTWGYDVDIHHLFSETSKSSIFQHSETLLCDLAAARISAVQKNVPLFFIAHSLGGIVVKDALQISAVESTYLKDILPATKAVMFLGTPHHGSKAASLGKVAAQVLKVFLQDPNDKVLRGLEVNSEILERISRGFGHVLATGNIQVHSFREDLDTYGIRIVNSFSSSIGYFSETRGSLPANHREMAKFISKNDIKFRRVASVLKIWARTIGKLRIFPVQTEIVEDLPDGLIFDEQYRKCQATLSSSIAKRRLNEVQSAYKNTFGWIFNKRLDFGNWLCGRVTDSVYWIQGKPGSGKSTAMKFAMMHPYTKRLLDRYNSNQWVIVGYFFHDRGALIQKTIRGFVGEILHQILEYRKDLFHLVLPVVAKLPDPDDTDQTAQSDIWTPSDIVEALLLIGTNTTSQLNLCIFVDALDEHDGDHNNLLAILQELGSLTSNDHFRLRLCVAGRPENKFKDAFHMSPGFAIHQHTMQDIKIYVQGRIKNESQSKMSRDGARELNALISEVVNRAQGVFIWVRLVTNELVEGICEGYTISELNELLSDIPTELHGLYKRALHRPRRHPKPIVERQRLETYVIFEIAMRATQPFTLYQILNASLYLTTEKWRPQELQKLSFDQMERRLNNLSFGLLELSGQLEGWIGLTAVSPRITYTQNLTGADTVGDSAHAPGSDEFDSNLEDSNHGSPVHTEQSGSAYEQSEFGDPDTALVQFIHQTAKEFMATNDGSTSIIENIPDTPKDSGHELLIRYFLHILTMRGADGYELDVEQLIVGSFMHHARAVENTGRPIHKLFDPTLIHLDSAMEILTEIATTESSPKYGSILTNVQRKKSIFLLLFYVFCNLKLSLNSISTTIKIKMTEDVMDRILVAFIDDTPSMEEASKEAEIRKNLLQSPLRSAILLRRPDLNDK
jgi:hypothetical protein